MAGRRLSLRTLVFTGGALLMLLPAVVAGTVYTGALQRRAEAMLVERLRGRGELSANLLARRLHQLWEEVNAFAKIVDLDAMPRVRQQIDLTTRLDNRYSWLGVADVDGKVLASSNGMLEGQSVAQRPWFRRGLSGPAAIDVHEAQLLSKLLPARTDPYRFIDLSAPIRKAGDTPGGVLGAHFDWRWLADNLASLQIPGIDIMLLSRDRVVLYGPPDLIDKPLTVGSAQAANRVTLSVLDERWPDGKDYVTVVVPAIGYSDLPSFGWSLLVRQDLDAALKPTRELVRDFWLTLGAGALCALILLFVGAHWITTPLRRLGRSAEAMLNDSDQKVPYAETRYDEAARLSSALVKLQSKLM